MTMKRTIVTSLSAAGLILAGGLAFAAGHWRHRYRDRARAARCPIAVWLPATGPSASRKPLTSP